MLQLREVQEQAIWLAEQNAILERELRDAYQSFSSMDPTSAIFVDSPMVVELGKTSIVLPTPMDPVVQPSSSSLTLSSIFLCVNGSDIGEHEVYP